MKTLIKILALLIAAALSMLPTITASIFLLAGREEFLKFITETMPANRFWLFGVPLVIMCYGTTMMTLKMMFETGSAKTKPPQLQSNAAYEITLQDGTTRSVLSYNSPTYLCGIDGDAESHYLKQSEIDALGSRVKHIDTEPFMLFVPHMGYVRNVTDLLDIYRLLRNPVVKLEKKL